jgi:hypothetical protein
MLRAKAREAVKNGKLPATDPRRTWGRLGSGKSCSVCGKPVKPAEMELEIEYRPDDGRAASLDHHHFHVPCLAAWECESHHYLAQRTITSNDPWDLASSPLRPAAAADAT